MNGSENYVAIAITEEDKLIYCGVLEALEREGYRLRYMDELNLSFSESLCRVYIPMFTKEFLLDQELMNNFHYMLSKNKVIVPIILENIVLPPELEMSIFSHIQSVMYWKYNDTSVLIEQLQYVYELDLCKDLTRIPRRQGRIEIDEDTFYEGEIRGEIRDGKGHMFWRDGYEYNGEWENDVMTGEGILIWNGKKYKGKDEFEDFIHSTRELD